MAGKSTNSNNSEKSDDTDSTDESDIIDAVEDEIEEAKEVVNEIVEDDASDVVEAEGVADSEGALDDVIDAEEITDEVEDADAVVVDEVVEDMPAEEPVAIAAAPEAPRRASFVPMVGGGLVAGAIGFFAANPTMLGLEGLESEATPDPRIEELAAEIQAIEPTDTSEISASIDTLTGNIATLTSDVEAIKSAPAPVVEDNGLAERVDALEADIANSMSGFSERLDAFEDRIADVAIAQSNVDMGPATAISDEALTAFQNDLASLTDDAKAQVAEAKAEVEDVRAQVEEAQAEIEKANIRAAEVEAEAAELAAQAAEAAAKAEQLAALAKLTSAVENGNSFADEIAGFENAPKALTAAAVDGVVGLTTLQQEFPDAARAALAGAATVPQDASAGEKLTAFLKRQTNARSLAPQEGDGVDAVLSRADAMVSSGDLAEAVNELASLSEDAAAAMEPWVAKAQSRLNALDALSELTAAVNEG